MLATVQRNAPVDSVAERMLLYQRQNGGWPQPGGNRINYKLHLSAATRDALLADRAKLDATIDDGATTGEIEHLVRAFKQTGNPAYRQAAERGLTYLLSAQNAAGGWPQFHPDSSGYRKHITYNDNAMISVLWLMKHVANGSPGFDALDKTLVPKAQQAVSRGIDCILQTQVVQNGRLTAWCAQHDSRTLKPAKARAFELPSLSGSETVGIVRFLMSEPNPSPDLKRAIEAAVAWLASVKLTGIAVRNIRDPNQPSGKDRIVVEDPASTLWARFYDLDTHKPFFYGRDSVKKWALADIENERRVGYAWYGTWPQPLLTKEYPAWRQKWEK